MVSLLLVRGGGLFRFSLCPIGLRDVEIVTFDELLRKICLLVDLLEADPPGRFACARATRETLASKGGIIIGEVARSVPSLGGASPSSHFDNLSIFRAVSIAERGICRVS